MLRLLLPEEQKKVRGEYLRRLSVLALYGVSFALVAWAFSLVPSFVFVQAEVSVLQEQVRVATDDSLNTEKKEIKEEIQMYTKQLSFIDDTDRVRFSEIIRTVTQNQVAGVTMSSIAVETTETEQGPVTQLALQGVSSTRNALATFKANMESNETFSDVELPFSSFARDTDIPFTMRLTVAVPHNETENQ